MTGPGLRRDWPLLEDREPSDLLSFLVGGLAGLTVHEAGHILAARACGARTSIEGTRTAGIPFFAVVYDRGLPPHKRYAVSSAGFWLQFGMSETILATHPNLRRDHAPFLKGAFAFHLITSLVYAYGALAKSGPPERDTLHMAQSQGIDERLVGVLVLLPAALDLYRYFNPDTRFATWTSRSLKFSFVLALGR